MTTTPSSPSVSILAPPAATEPVKAPLSPKGRFTGSAAIITRLDKTFSEDLTHEDRARLRHIVRKAAPYLFKADDSNRHVDQVIDALGPKVMRQRLLQAIADGKVA